MTRWLPLDLALPLLLVLCLNLLPASCHEASRPQQLRTDSYRQQRERIDTLPENARIDVVILGDSRSRRIDALVVCDELGLRVCINLSTSGGDWITVHELYSELQGDLGPESLVVVGISDFWLEMGGHYPLGVIPRSTTYARFGDPTTTLASFLPLSLARGSRVATVRDWIDDRASQLYRQLTGSKPPRNRSAFHPNPSKLGRSNVDRWFLPTNEDDRQTRVRQGFGVLRDMLAHNRVALLYLPNPQVRERYVDTYYPGRRRRFFAEINQIAGELALPFVNLSGQMPRPNLYRDFHHLADESIDLISARVADRLREYLPDPQPDHQPDYQPRRGASEQ